MSEKQKPPYSPSKWAGNLLFISGQLALVDGSMVEGGIKEQTHQVMKNIKAILQQNNLSLAHVIRTEIFMTNMDDYSIVNEIYTSYFDSEYPARQAFEVSRLPKDALIEISVIAVKS